MALPAQLVFIVSLTGSWEILVRMAIPTRTVCARGYSHAHNTLVLVHISVRVAKLRAQTVRVGIATCTTISQDPV